MFVCYFEDGGNAVAVVSHMSGKHLTQKRPKIKGGQGEDYSFNFLKNVFVLTLSSHNVDASVSLIFTLCTHQDMPASLKRICQFLGVELPNSKIEDIARFVEFKNMKEAYGDDYFIRKGVLKPVNLFMS